jgi:hypothetical protein
MKVVAQGICISSLQKPVLAAECSPGHCGIDVFWLKTSEAAFFSFLPVFWLFSATPFSARFLP